MNSIMNRCFVGSEQDYFKQIPTLIVHPGTNLITFSVNRCVILANIKILHLRNKLDGSNMKRTLGNHSL